MKKIVRKKKNFSKIAIFLFVIVVLTIDILLFMVWQKNKEIHSLPTASAVKNDTFDYKREEQRLKKTLTTTDNLQATYDDFVSMYLPYDESLVHSLAHIVGEELYRRNNMKGVTICDESFSFGCYHGFFGLALQIEGDKVIAEAEKICQKNQSATVQLNGCMHGLGHGIVITQGYTVDDLLISLKKCDFLSFLSQRPCYNGVFMEYNRRVPFAAYGQELGVRELNNKNPYEPCDRLPKRYKSECYIEQPAWWSVTVPGLIYKEKMTNIGNLCDTIQEKDYQSECFSGVARAIPLGTDLNKAQNDLEMYCMLMPSENGRQFCIESAIQILLAKKVSTASELCSSLESSRESACIKNVKAFACKEFQQCNLEN